MKLEVDVFFDGTALTEYLKREKAPDILFLDIELPGMDGVEVGKYVRDILRNLHMFLVYISSKEEYALELFQNQPFDFLIKPIKKNDCIMLWKKYFVFLTKASVILSIKIRETVTGLCIRTFCIFKVMDEKLIL